MLLTVKIFPDKRIVFPDHVPVPAAFLRDRHGTGIHTDVLFFLMFHAFRYMGMSVQ